jgi:hypothetical protein
MRQTASLVTADTFDRSRKAIAFGPDWQDVRR